MKNGRASIYHVGRLCDDELVMLPGHAEAGLRHVR
jgi:hypothetical protein